LTVTTGPRPRDREGPRVLARLGSGAWRAKTQVALRDWFPISLRPWLAEFTAADYYYYYYYYYDDDDDDDLDPPKGLRSAPAHRLESQARPSTANRPSTRAQRD
jgi:hypothetical protein